jgi:hypothetical protein
MARACGLLLHSSSHKEREKALKQHPSLLELMETEKENVNHRRCPRCAFVIYYPLASFSHGTNRLPFGRGPSLSIVSAPLFTAFNIGPEVAHHGTHPHEFVHPFHHSEKPPSSNSQHVPHLQEGGQIEYAQTTECRAKLKPINLSGKIVTGFGPPRAFGRITSLHVAQWDSKMVRSLYVMHPYDLTNKPSRLP